MPGSWQGNDRYFIDDLKQLIKPNTAIDVGIGAAKIGWLLREHAPGCRVTGHEIWEPHLTPEYRAFYETIIIGDFSDWIERNKDWTTDLIVFGDVLEHMLYHRAMSVLDHCYYRVRWMALQVPINMVQDTTEDNPHSPHQCNITWQDLARFNVVHYVKALEVDIFYCLIKGIR